MFLLGLWAEQKDALFMPYVRFIYGLPTAYAGSTYAERGGSYPVFDFHCFSLAYVKELRQKDENSKCGNSGRGRTTGVKCRTGAGKQFIFCFLIVAVK
jgi:hypothetical protein